MLSFRGPVPRLDGTTIDIEDDAVVLDAREIVGVHAARPFVPGFLATDSDAPRTPVECSQIVVRNADTVIVAESRGAVLARAYVAQREHGTDGFSWPVRADGEPAFPNEHEALFGNGGKPGDPLMAYKRDIVDRNPCPVCGQPPGSWCTSVFGQGLEAGDVHGARSA